MEIDYLTSNNIFTTRNKKRSKSEMYKKRMMVEKEEELVKGKSFGSVKNLPTVSYFNQQITAPMQKNIISPSMTFKTSIYQNAPFKFTEININPIASKSNIFPQSITFITTDKKIIEKQRINRKKKSNSTRLFLPYIKANKYSDRKSNILVIWDKIESKSKLIAFGKMLIKDVSAHLNVEKEVMGCFKGNKKYSQNIIKKRKSML